MADSSYFAQVQTFNCSKLTVKYGFNLADSRTPDRLAIYQSTINTTLYLGLKQCKSSRIRRLLEIPMLGIHFHLATLLCCAHRISPGETSCDFHMTLGNTDLQPRKRHSTSSIANFPVRTERHTVTGQRGLGSWSGTSIQLQSLRTREDSNK